MIEAPPHADRIEGLEKHWLEGAHARVEAWFLPSHLEGPRPAVVFAHGNGELIDFWPQMLEPYRQLGFHVVLPEYRSYGRSTGEPSQDTIVSDFVGFYDILAAREDVTDFVFHGRSLGGGVICALADARPAQALVLESTFSSMTDMLAAWMVPSMLVADPFDNLASVERFAGPKLVMHGSHDSIVPYKHAQKLAATANSTLVTYEADHNDFPPDRMAYWHEIEQFLRQHTALVAGTRSFG